ncbi:MAG: hypothetical protein F6J87_13575 [Spirulina sp. SIO3F2]|nr:hypothetical protein [Spirulina sp. SIO3F2]
MIGLGTLLLFTPTAQALPPADDPPEEVLRSEIILDGRSAIDGEPLTAAEYVQEQEALAESAYPPELAAEIQHVIFLLRLRQLLKPIVPFIP